MKLTSASVYAVRGLAFLAQHPSDRLVTAATIAGAEGLSELYLRKVLMPLVSTGVLRSVMGPGGGYRLGRPARAVSLLDVVEAVDGPIRGNVPRWTTAPTDARLDARLQRVCDVVAEAVRERLAGVTVAELVGSAKKPQRGAK
jgi:Rrf2 family protein